MDTPKQKISNGVNKKFVFLVVFAAVLYFVLVSFGNVFAVGGSVVINEVAWMGTETSSSDEWIELYNNGSSDIDLTGWGIFESGGETLVEPLEGVIKTGEYFLIERTDDSTVPHIPASQPPSSWGGYGLNNLSGEHLVLKDNLNNIVDNLDASQGWLAGSNSSKQTMERRGGGWQSSALPGGTPKAPNSAGSAPEEPLDSPPPQNDEEESNNSALFFFDFGDVVINEFVADPETGQREWVELYNRSGKEINLTDWKISDGTGAILSLFGNLKPAGQERLTVFDLSYSKFNNSGDIIILSASNGTVIDQVTYGDWYDGNLSDNAPAAARPDSVARIRDGHSSGNNALDFALTITPTKGASNIITAKGGSALTEDNQTGDVFFNENSAAEELTSNQKEDNAENKTKDTEEQFNQAANFVFINEILPDPVGSDALGEWIELWNSGTQDLVLGGWQIDDAEGGSRSFVLGAGTKIAAGGYLLLERRKTGIALNNDGDDVRLLNPQNEVALKISYENVPEGMSYARDHNDKWQITSEVTPLAANIIKTPEGKTKNVQVRKTGTILSVTIERARGLDLGAEIRIKGVVSVEPRILGSQIFYLAGLAADSSAKASAEAEVLDDESASAEALAKVVSGIQVYMYKKDFPDLKLGDYIEVTGTISEAGGERRIKLAGKQDIKVIESGGKIEGLLPKEITNIEVGEEAEGALVRVSGEVIEVKSGGDFLIDDGTSEARIYIKPATGIANLNLGEADRVSVVGIVSQTSSGYRILPRYKSDIEILKPEIKAEVARDADGQRPIIKYLAVTATALGIGLASFLRRRKMKRL